MRWHGTRWITSHDLQRKPLGVRLKTAYPNNPQRRINTHRVFCRPFLVASASHPCSASECAGVEAARGELGCA